LITATICNLINAGCQSYDLILSALHDNSVNNDYFYSYQYYKSILNWKSEIDVPVIGCMFDKSTVHLQYAYINRIKELFINDGHNCILLTGETIPNISESVFSSAKPDLHVHFLDIVKLYFNLLGFNSPPLWGGEIYYL